MMPLKADNIPECLKALNSWVVWKLAPRKEGDKPTKLPFHPSGEWAKANDPSTWAPFFQALNRFNMGGYSGIGFEFSEEDPFCGVDLDGCRDPESGKVEEWAREIILKMNSYAEVSPSGTGIKIFCRGFWGPGKKVPVPGAEAIGQKEPGIEVYEWGRYFAVTGLRVKGPSEPREAKEELEWLRLKYFQKEQALVPYTRPLDSDPVLDRARKYVMKLPLAVSGSSGHNATFKAACACVLGFELSEGEAMSVMAEYNTGCQPQWSESELLHKVRQAAKQTGDRGYLKNAQVANWGRIYLPNYREEQPAPEIRETTLADAAQKYLDSVKEGKAFRVELGIPDLDYALGGGVEPGEMVIMAARPSHGKSAVALQCLHHWTSEGIPCAIVSEEMSAMALGKRTIQFISNIPEDQWADTPETVQTELTTYSTNRAPCYVVEGCGTAAAAASALERHVKENGVKYAVVDYAQLLKSPGKGRYEEVTNTSIALRKLASSTGLVLVVLCQLSRDIEKRSKDFSPVMSDLKDTGQLEQDADVIMFLCWPHRLDATQPENKYQFFVTKNRNRPINQSLVECRWIPSRQKIMTQLPAFAEREIVPERDRAY